MIRANAGRIAGAAAVAGALLLCGAGDIAAHELKVSGEYTANRGDSRGSRITRMLRTERSMCFLTGVGFEDIDSFREWAKCDIYASGGYWHLRARLNKGPDANAYCNARCITW